MAGGHIIVDRTQMTNIDGVYAAVTVQADLISMPRLLVKEMLLYTAYLNILKNIKIISLTGDN